ncbi:hypothetical protein CVIRNUC_004775 [Coccomyxa viridis]|uniref:N-acetyl-D-glucosamine kinase n=1 Tax=Coccomyxa viridis TaxID=1274662 RepID=A0AAV1I526_9CHLO|nr:hypothetical protein CVIRNUC_004775 [Coccomyxa viridis]
MARDQSLRRQVLVGVDGGGSKTDCVILDAQTKELLGRSAGGASNWNSVGQDAALNTLKAAITGALAAARVEQDGILGMCLGMSGVDREADASSLKARLQEWLPAEVELVVYNDSVIALACGTGGPLHGCVLVVGTGIIALGIGRSGNHVRASGWGPAFLDMGSGYDIGQRALAAVARAVDGRGERTDLVEATCRHCGVRDPQDLLQWAYAEAGWSRIASLAPAVLQCAEEGDSIAFKIVTSAAHEALEAVIAVATRTKLKSQRFKLVLSGGLLSRDSPFLDIILEGVKLRLPSAGVAYPRVEPAIGAALLVHDALYGADEAPSSIGEAACSSASRDGSPPRCQDRHGVHPGSHGKHSSRDGGWAGNLRKHRRAVSNVDAAFMKHVMDMPPMRASSNADGLGSVPQPGLDRLRLDDAGGTDSPRRQRRHSRYHKSLEML